MENPINVDETISQTTKEPIKNESKAARSSSGDRSDDGSGSPPPNCSICLGKLINTSFTDSCFHQFCFTCLLQWSKIKTECPLCKQTFKSIIHNVRGERDYDQYHVPRDVPQAISQQFPPTATVDVNLEIVRGPHYDYGGYPHRLAYRTTMTTPNQRRYRMLLNPSVSRPETVANIAQQVSIEERRRRSEHPITYRRNVYRNGQWSAELASAYQRPLEHSAEYFRRNPCELERLIPWINRDLQILLNANDPRIAYVLDVILDALKEYDLRSAELRDRLREFFSIHTDHFIHELMNFAQTGIDLATYDNFITYPPPNSLTNSYVNTLQSPVLSDNSSTASDDSDVRVVDEIDSMSINNTNNNNNNNNNFNNINMNSYPLLATHTIDMPGPSTVSQTFQMPIVNSVRSLRHIPSPDILTISSSSSSDENDCEFVGYIKPRHERTPEIIELMSSDGDDNGDNDHAAGGAAGGTAGASGGGGAGASISVDNFNEDNDDLNNIEIINTNDNNSFTPISTSLDLLEPKPGTSHDFNYDDHDDDNSNRRTRRTRRKKTLIQNISYDLSTNESSSESESDSDSDYGEKKKKTCKSKRKLTKTNKNNLKKKSTTSTSKNMKKKKVKTRFKKVDSATSSNDNDDKIGGENNTKTIASVVVKVNDNSNDNSNNNNNNHTEDSDSSTSFSESSSWSLSSSRSSSKNTYNNDKNNKKRKKKLTSKTNKRGKYLTKTKKNNDKTKNKKNNNCPPVSTVLRKKTDKNNEWYVDKQRFNCIYSSNTSDDDDDDDDKGEDGTSFINKSSSIKKEENYKWNDNFNDGIGSNDELASSRNKTDDDTELTNQMDVCSDTNNSNKYKSKYHDKYKKIYHDIDQPCTSSQSLTSCTSSLSSFKYSDDKKSSSDKRHKSHKKYKSSKRGKNKKDSKKHRSSSSSSSSESFTN